MFGPWLNSIHVARGPRVNVFLASLNEEAGQWATGGGNLRRIDARGV